MKKLLVTAAVLALSAGVAHADYYGSPYLSLGGGWNHSDESDFKSAGVKDKVEYDEGWLGEAAVGYAWGNVRAEIEGAYRHNDVDKVKGTGASGGTGDFHTWTAMGNVLYDFKNSTPFTPYLGVGVGAAFEDASNIGNAFAASTTINKDDTQFAYQGIAGVDYWITSKSALGLRYDYLGTTEGKFKTSSGADVKGEYSDNAVLVNYRIGF